MKSPMPTVEVMKGVDERQLRPHGGESDPADVIADKQFLFQRPRTYTINQMSARRNFRITRMVMSCPNSKP